MKAQGGFTLIELLVVIAILAVLFGVTALALNGVGSNAEAVTAAAEKDVVQTAIDVYMATSNLATLPPALVPTNAELLTPSAVDFHQYLRRASKYYYCWDANGKVTMQQTAALPVCP